MIAEPLLALVVIVYVSLGVSGELLLSRAMRRMPKPHGLTLPECLRVIRYVFTTPLVCIGTGLLARSGRPSSPHNWFNM